MRKKINLVLEPNQTITSSLAAGFTHTRKINIRDALRREEKVRRRHVRATKSSISLSEETQSSKRNTVVFNVESCRAAAVVAAAAAGEHTESHKRIEECYCRARHRFSRIRKGSPKRLSFHDVAYTFGMPKEEAALMQQQHQRRHKGGLNDLYGLTRAGKRGKCGEGIKMRVELSKAAIPAFATATAAATDCAYYYARESLRDEFKVNYFFLMHPHVHGNVLASFVLRVANTFDRLTVRLGEKNGPIPPSPGEKMDFPEKKNTLYAAVAVAARLHLRKERPHWRKGELSTLDAAAATAVPRHAHVCIIQTIIFEPRAGALHVRVRILRYSTGAATRKVEDSLEVCARRIPTNSARVQTHTEAFVIRHAQTTCRGPTNEIHCDVELNEPDTPKERERARGNKFQLSFVRVKYRERRFETF
uniref:Uncharacterized protein n=1 Tax=Trichogramma kaykai TaxID=54128 RepID=A0ABD2WLA1_9HYME